MNRLLASIILVLTAVSASAQAPAGPQPAANVERVASIPKTDLLTPFTAIEIDGPLNVNMKHVDDESEVKIVYDTKGSMTSKFRATVNKDGVLRVEERFDQKRTTVTDVTVYYSTLEKVRVSAATVAFEEPLERRVFDMSVSGGAIVTLGIRTLDTFIECTGQSRIVLSGESRYFKLNVSTAKIDAWDLSTVSSIVEASHGAEVRLNVSERLEAVTSTAARLLYRGKPEIIRNRSSLFGGDIVSVD